MKLYFLRHGESDPQGSKREEDRQMTDAGRRSLRAAARLWRRLDIRPEVVISSPRQRVIDSAELFIDGVALSERLVIDERLAPGAKWPDFAIALAQHPQISSALFVGHEPDLSSSIEFLTGAASVKMREGSICCIEFAGSPSGSSGTLTFLIDPDLYKKEDGRDAPTCAPD